MSAAALAIEAAIRDAFPGVAFIGVETFWPRFEVLINDPVAKLKPIFGGWNPGVEAGKEPGAGAGVEDLGRCWGGRTVDD